MLVLIAGLVLFLGIHSVRIAAPAWRDQQIAQRGEKPWKTLYSIASAVGLGLIIGGFDLARENPVLLWVRPTWAPHLTIPMVVIAFILFAASGGPGNRIKRTVRHPMVAGTALWAAGHLLSNGTLADLLLFGAFLAWAVIAYVASLARDRRTGAQYAGSTLRADLIPVAAGLVLSALFIFVLHRWLFGVSPLS